MNFENTAEFARQLDENDPLHAFRDQFYIPLLHKKESVYLAGHTLGLQPKTTHDKVVDELEDWANYGKEGRQHARNPWGQYHDAFPLKLTALTGAHPHELVVMNSLTTNLHLLLTTFFRVQKTRYKILCAEKSFAASSMALESHIGLSGLPKEALVWVAYRPGETVLRHEDILQAIREAGDELALVFMDGVNYLTGEVLDMKAITEAAHAVGARCGFDLAHAIGNVDLQLHAWKVDFAVWCTYKYLNSGPGSIGGAYIHEDFARDTSLPRLAGWWGNNKENKFKANACFLPETSAEGWQLSSPSILDLAAHGAALDVFQKAGWRRLLQKSNVLRKYLWFVVEDVIRETKSDKVEIISPKNHDARGNMISLKVKENPAHMMEILRMNSIIADLIHDDVLRISATPLYNSYTDVFTFGQVLEAALTDHLKLHKA